MAQYKPGETVNPGGSVETAKETAVQTKKRVRISLRKPPKFFMLMLLVVGVIAAAFIAGYILKYLPAERLRRAQREYNQVVSTSAGFETEAKHDQSIKTWQDYINKPPRQEFRFDAQLSLGNAYYNAKKYQEARDAYQKARELMGGQDTIPTAQSIARTSELLGDKPTAIEQYTKVIELTEQYKNGLPEKDGNRFQAEQDIELYRKKLEELRQ